MDMLDQKHLRELVADRRGPCVSLLMSTHRQKETAPEDPIRWKRLLQQAARELAAAGQKPAEVKRLLEPAQSLADDRNFWAGREAGLAVYLAADYFLALRLPIPLDEKCVVAGRFQVTPLLPLLEPEHEFHVLAVSQKHVRLVRCRRIGAADVTPADMPSGLVAALNLDQPEEMRQFHGGVAQGKGPRTTVFHGQGGAPADARENIAAYFRQIDAALHPHLAGEKLPLVFAGVDFLFPIYRQVNTYPHLLDEHISGNPDLLTAEPLHQAGERLMAPRREQALAEILRRCGEAADQRGPCELGEVLAAAQAGRIDTLLVAHDLEQWGTFDPVSGQVTLLTERRPGAEELLNLATIETLRHGGRVGPMELARLPGQVPVAATFRYETTTTTPPPARHTVPA